MDIFDNQILCKDCKKVMKPVLISKNGFNLRCVKCPECNGELIHPLDKNEYDDFIKLKKKDFEVKMRMVGNSYAISIPREIVDFMREQENLINNMVKLNFEDIGRLSLMFNTPEMQENENAKSRVIRAKELRIIRNNKPVIHTKQFFDSAHPERNKIKIFKAKKNHNEELEDDR